MPALNPQLTVNKIVQQWPETMGVFAQHSIDLCCGGSKTVEAVASLHGIELAQLLSQLEAAIEARDEG